MKGGRGVVASRAGPDQQTSDGTHLSDQRSDADLAPLFSRH